MLFREEFLESVRQLRRYLPADCFQPGHQQLGWPAQWHPRLQAFDAPRIAPAGLCTSDDAREVEAIILGKSSANRHLNMIAETKGIRPFAIAFRWLGLPDCRQ